jgi:hypothetical protein
MKPKWDKEIKTKVNIPLNCEHVIGNHYINLE